MNILFETGNCFCIKISKYSIEAFLFRITYLFFWKAEDCIYIGGPKYSCKFSKDERDPAMILELECNDEQE